MKHNKFDEVLILTNAGIATLLTGEKGSGKTTLAKQIADGLRLPFHAISMTRQTTLSHLLGFRTVDGTYSPSQLRGAVENGGLFLLDELDAGDANVLLCLNTIENGYVSFPDGVVEVHKDFRLMATSNPQDEHEHYVGRNKLDAATLDRFDIIDLDHDEALERSLVDEDVFQHIKALRLVIKEVNSSKTISMRDAIRYQKRKNLELLEGFMFRLTGKSALIHDKYLTAVSHIPKYANQAECKTIDDLFDLIKIDSAEGPAPAPEPSPF